MMDLVYVNAVPAMSPMHDKLQFEISPHQDVLTAGKSQRRSRRRHKAPRLDKQKLSKPRVVRIDEDSNQYYDNTQLTHDEVQSLCWYSVTEYTRFRQDQKRNIGLIRSNGLIWMDPHSIPTTLLRIYTTFRTAQTVEDVEPVWNATQLRHHPGLIGLERSAIATIPQDFMRRRRDCLTQIAWLQTQAFRKQEDRDAVIRVTARQSSRVARLYARYVGDLVARTP